MCKDRARQAYEIKFILLDHLKVTTDLGGPNGMHFFKNTLYKKMQLFFFLLSIATCHVIHCIDE